MPTKFLISLKNAFSEYAARHKAVADAKYAFKNFDLRTDVYTVARRFKGENGNTIGAELVRKYPNVNPILPARSYVGLQMDESTAKRIHQLFEQA